MMIKVISLWQPWALAMWLGIKCYETRGGDAPVLSQLRRWDGMLGIHAAQLPWTHAVDKAFPNETPKFRRDWALKAIEYMKDAPADKSQYGILGGICKRGNIYRTEQIRDSLSEQERHFGNYADGRRAIWLPKMVKLPTPIPMRGHQGLWDWEVPKDIQELLEEKWGKSA